MIIIKTCTECGHDLVDVELSTYPPIPAKYCSNCGYTWTSTPEDIVRIPFDPNKERKIISTTLKSPISPSSVLYEQSPCVNCSNNPRNGSSGICHCTLGLPTIYC